MATSEPTSRGPGRPRRQDGVTQDGLRDRLLDIAVTLFARDGVGPTTLAAIAREAGVTAPMVHYHFKSRDQLLDAVVEGRIRPLVDQVTRPALAIIADDAHLPDLVSWALAREARADDRRMLELLEPYKGQRRRDRKSVV